MKFSGDLFQLNFYCKYNAALEGNQTIIINVDKIEEKEDSFLIGMTPKRLRNLERGKYYFLKFLAEEFERIHEVYIDAYSILINKSKLKKEYIILETV